MRCLTSLKPDVSVQGSLYLNEQQPALADVLVLQSQMQSVHLHDALHVIPRTICPCRRDHFTRIRESETPGDDQAQASIAARTKFIVFMVNRVLTKEQVEHQRELKDLPGNLDYRRESPTVQSYIDGSRQKEWKKYEDFQAAIPLKGKELSDLLEAGHVPIPSKWVDTIKNIHEKHKPDYVPEF